MSRHSLSPRPGTPEILRAVIGWDRPLQSFFAQVFVASAVPGEEDGEDAGEVLLWIGTEPGELPTPEAAIAVVESYAIIPSHLAEALRRDMNAGLGQRDGPLQIAMKRLVFGSIH